MKVKYQILLLAFFLSSCSGDECGNTSPVYGKYVNDSYPNDTNYIVLKEDGTYFYYYKKKNQKEKVFNGKWKLSSTLSDCTISFFLWKDIVGYMNVDEVGIFTVSHRNDKILFFEGLQADYEKKE